jgi:hypothetical protein
MRACFAHQARVFEIVAQRAVNGGEQDHVELAARRLVRARRRCNGVEVVSLRATHRLLQVLYLA